jgi:hypothetical protein
MHRYLGLSTQSSGCGEALPRCGRCWNGPPSRVVASAKKACFLIMATGLCLIPRYATARGSPALLETPAPTHRFLDGKTVALQAFSIALMAADVASTTRALQAPGTREANPLLQSSAALVSFKVGAAATGLTVAYALHRTGHHRAERLIPLVFGIPSGIAAAHNFGTRR